MANSQLMGQQFGVPVELQQFTGGPTISYSMLKKLKNFFDYTDNTHPHYNNKGGEKMKTFINASLGDQRNRVIRSSDIKSKFTTNNGFKKTHNKNNQTKNVTGIGGNPMVYKSSTNKHIYNDEMTYETEIKRIQDLIIYESKI